MNKSDIVERLRDAMVEVDYGDRLMAADEIERLRAALAEQQERFISLAVAAAAEVQATLGHGNIATTSGYLHARPDSSSELRLDPGVFLR
jgi:hypothetical protein